MPICEPSGHGLIFQRGPFTRSILRRLQEELGDVFEGDEHIAGVSIGASFEGLLPWLEALQHAGLQRGLHYVVTLTGEGVVGDMPDWLDSAAIPQGRLYSGVPTPTAPARWSARIGA